VNKLKTLRTTEAPWDNYGQLLVIMAIPDLQISAVRLFNVLHAIPYVVRSTIGFSVNSWASCFRC